MKKIQLATELASSLNTTVKEAEHIVHEMMRIMRNGLENDGVVVLRSFGEFKVQHKNERVARNPKTGEQVTVTARNVVTFKASNKLKQAVN